MSSFFSLILFCAALPLPALLFPGQAAELINIDFGAGPATGKAGPAAFGLGPLDFWNYYERKTTADGFSAGGVVNDLKTSDRTATMASVTVENAPGAWGNQVADPMFDSYLYPFDDGKITLTFKDLPPGLYSLYLYGHGGPGLDAANSVFEVVSGMVDYGSKATTTGPGWNSADWREGDQYVRFDEVDVRAGDLLVIRVGKGSHREAYLNGAQLVRTDVVSAPLSIAPNGGAFTNSVQVTLRKGVREAEVRYTLDGAEPVLGSPLYSGPLQITATTTLKARLFVNGFPASEVVSAVFTADPGLRFDPPEAKFTNQLEVTMSSRIASAQIRYTTDGSEPGVGSTLYSGPIQLTSAATLKARAFLNSFPVTETIAGVYERVYAFDDDGISRAWRIRHFSDRYATNPSAAAEADPDRDGASNRQEFLGGTDPLDPLSGFVVRVRAVPEIRFGSLAGKTYRILRLQSLTGGEARVIAEITATGDETLWTDHEAGAAVNPAFYIVQPAP